MGYGEEQVRLDGLMECSGQISSQARNGDGLELFAKLSQHHFGSVAQPTFPNAVDPGAASKKGWFPGYCRTIPVELATSLVRLIPSGAKRRSTSIWQRVRVLAPNSPVRMMRSAL